MKTTLGNMSRRLTESGIDPRAKDARQQLDAKLAELVDSEPLTHLKAQAMSIDRSLAGLVYPGPESVPAEGTWLLESGERVGWIGVDPAEPGSDKTVLSAQVLACPFCGGPPCPFVGKAEHPYGAVTKQDDYGDDGLLVQAHVFCHSCGAEGPMFEGTLFTRDDYLNAKQLGITYWNKRGDHPELEVRQWQVL